MSDIASVSIMEASIPDDVAAVRALFLDYANSLGFSLCFQGFDQELAALPGKYAPPAGCILLARVDAAVAGVVAVRPLEGGLCEMKRLYVRPEHRGHKLGRRLAEAVIDAAGRIGYRAMRLDTLDSMIAGIALYRSLGFREIAPYYDNPIAGAVYFERAL
jgi:ribosomal protein S18 acetylase RimI-like enzyme